MALPGFRTRVELIRTGQSGQAADGTPTVTTTTIWTKLGHYQQQQGIFKGAETGYSEYEVYRFWLPFLTGTDRPQMADLLRADGYEYIVVGIEQETLNHHLIVKAHRSEE